ncbi:MAG TPA: SLBB domain-containing protein, partial [Smithellaceae bacterium]|nr:SLBB domain-containing protein [Smithellaceae bacterium]
QSLTPAQQQAIQGELGKTGGKVTPQAIDALKGRPEFQSISPADIEKGKQLLEQKEKGQEKQGTEKFDRKVPWAEKTVVGGETTGDSLFDRSRKVGNYQDISLKLQLFGTEFFRESAVRVVTDRKDIPVPLKYVVGPGDEVKLLLWGRLNAQYTLTVDRDGKITIPQVGPMFVAGMTFEDMSKYLITQAEQIVGTNIDVSMGALKTISVFVLGDVRRPGAYTIGSFATITDALVMVGGASDIGSLRRIQLRRGNKLITTFDLYDLLLKGDKSKDVILQSGDVIFVPVTGPQVGIAGNVKRPAIYEMKDRHDLQSLIEYAGGIIPSADTQQIQVERIVKGEKQIVLDVNDKHLEKAYNVALHDADLVKIFSIVDANVNAIYLSGNVKRPGKYEYKPGMTIKDILKPEELLPETHYDYALIKRLKPPSMEAMLIPFNLGKFLFQQDPANNVALQPQDEIFVFNKWLFKDKPYVTIEGEIRGICSPSLDASTAAIREKQANAAMMKGGMLQSDLLNTTLSRSREERSNLSLLKLQAMDTELRVNAEANKMILSRLKKVTDEIRAGENTPIRDILELRDELKLQGKIDLANRMDSILEDLKSSCKISLVEGMKVRDAVLYSGGLTNNSYLEKGEIIRVDDQNKYTVVHFDLGRAMAGQATENVPLQHKDQIIIHSIHEHAYKKTVSIDGDIMKPGTFQFVENMRVKDLVFAAGNIMESAYLDDAEITSMDIEKGSSVKMVQKNINLRRALAGDPAHNIPLKPYDRVFVKKIMDWRDERYATVGGEVKFPGRYQLAKGEKLSSLIQRAGGYTDEAYLRGAIFTRQKVREMQQKSIDEMTDRLEKELLSQGAGVSTALSAEEVAAKKAEMEQKKQFIVAMRNSKAMGRMTIKLAHLRLLKGSEYDVEIEDGDSLVIPEKTSVVGVAGAVMSQGAFVYREKADYRDYINMSGGYTRYADTANVYVLKVDGSARKAYSSFIGWNDKKDRHELAAFSETDGNYIEPGDVIAVPENFERIAWLREIRDISQILVNTAIASGNLVLLIRSF